MSALATSSREFPSISGAFMDVETSSATMTSIPRPVTCSSTLPPVGLARPTPMRANASSSISHLFTGRRVGWCAAILEIISPVANRSRRV
ncbi:MAG: hypothetical protein BWY66_02620 [bacterium ADurb.Bin374]|nr:MAG: hypothetical protein BWY66_02620 [bacterium ADurb.Bin374]